MTAAEKQIAQLQAALEEVYPPGAWCPLCGADLRGPPNPSGCTKCEKARAALSSPVSEPAPVECDPCACRKGAPGMWTSGYDATCRSFVRHGAKECEEFTRRPAPAPLAAMRTPSPPETPELRTEGADYITEPSDHRNARSGEIERLIRRLVEAAKIHGASGEGYSGPLNEAENALRDAIRPPASPASDPRETRDPRDADLAMAPVATAAMIRAEAFEQAARLVEGIAPDFVDVDVLAAALRAMAEPPEAPASETGRGSGEEPAAPDDLELCTCGATRDQHGGPYGEGACEASSCEAFTSASPSPSETR